jgi:hypothetical protein
MGLIAHPGKITNLISSYDGKYLFTSGGNDLTVNMWVIDFKSFENSSSKGGSGLDPFIALIEGGKGGSFWNEMKEYFHYAQIKK